MLECSGQRLCSGGFTRRHPHLDHYGGMVQVLEEVEVGTFYTNGNRSDSRLYERLEAALAARGVPTQVVRRGDRLDALSGPCSGPQVAIDVLYPDEEAIGLSETQNDANDASVVLRVTHGTQRFLLTGDAEWAEEERLLELEGTKLRAEVLKLGHHASVLSGKPEFLRTVRPLLAIAQGTDGANVPVVYPRPSPRIRWTLRDMGVPLRTTDHQGALQVISDGKSVRWHTLFGPRLRHGMRLSWSRDPSRNPEGRAAAHSRASGVAVRLRGTERDAARSCPLDPHGQVVAVTWPRRWLPWRPSADSRSSRPSSPA